MVGESIIEEILTYLEKKGPTNTFRLASVIGMERYQLLNILKKLEEKQAVKFEYGNVIFLKFVSEEISKPVEVQKISLTSEKVVRRKPAKSKVVQLLQTENKQLQGKLSELKETIKELEKKASAHPNTIIKTITKIRIKKVPVIKKIPVPSLKKREKKVKEKPKVKRKFKLFTFLKKLKIIKKPKFVK